MLSFVLWLNTKCLADDQSREVQTPRGSCSRHLMRADVSEEFLPARQPAARTLNLPTIL